MGQPIPQQHPAVVLRSHYQHIKALLAVALVSIAALAVTAVLMATDSDAPSAHAKSVSQQSAVQSKASPVIRRCLAPGGSGVGQGVCVGRTVGIGR